MNNEPTVEEPDDSTLLLVDAPVVRMPWRPRFLVPGAAGWVDLVIHR